MVAVFLTSVFSMIPPLSLCLGFLREGTGEFELLRKYLLGNKCKILQN